MPEQVDGMEPHAAVHAPIQDVRGDREGPIQEAPELRRPIRARERAPPSAGRAHEVAPEDDERVVPGEPVPEGAEVDEHGTRGHRGVEPLSAHAAPRTTPRPPASAAAASTSRATLRAA